MRLENKVILGILFLMSSYVLAEGLKSEGKVHPQFLIEQNKVELTVDDGFHFNKEAPTFILSGKQKIKPASLSEKSLKFQWKETLEKDSKIQFYVCDDAKTVCEPHSIPIKNQSQAAPPSSIKAPKGSKTGAHLDPKQSKKRLGEGLPTGFIEDDYDLALSKAKKENKKLFIDFGARWCPPCIRLEHETFVSTLFQKAAKPYILLRIDVDKDQNQSLNEKYSVKAYPTLIVTNSDGVELDRILDYLPPEALATKLKELNKNTKLLTKEELVQRAQEGDKAAAASLGQMSFKALQYKECLDWFEKSKQRPIEYYMCSVGLSEDLKDQEKIVTLQKAIQSFPDSFYSIDWRLQLVELLQGAKIGNEKELSSAIDQTKSLIQKWLQEPERLNNAFKKGELLELKDLITSELHFYLGTLSELLKNKEEALKEFKMAVEITKTQKPTLKNPTIIIYLAHYLKKAELYSESLEWLQKLAAEYPEEYTYVQRQANLLNEIKEYQKALPLAEKAYQLSYGNNRLKSGLFLAKLNKELKKKAEAKAVLEELKTSSAAQWPGNKGYSDKIQKALVEL